ncbi:MAG: cobalt ECF transporter T component CbiQ [Leptolyngbyaceae cyanobacterium HOT.MB2.61]|jgi:cobalt/nickel transport system permease protein|nr:cobalt ECF transporter T component CbiQ [Leptolyngbyaceae cyanobacterium HOT.MB2.61]
MGIRLNLDTHTNGDSPIHCWRPAQKLIGLGVLVFAFAAVQDLRLVPAMLLVTGGLYAASGLPVSLLLNRFRYPGFFLLGIILLLPFVSGGTVVWQWGILALRQEGCITVLLITARFFSILTLGLILLGTTPFVTLVRTMRSLGLPPVLADMTLLSYRYLYDIADNLATMQTAMRLRGFSNRTRKGLLLPNGQTLKQLAALAGSLLIRSYEQAEQVYQAMRLRGYTLQNSKFKTQSSKFKTLSWSTTALFLTLLVAASFVIAEFLL